MTSTGFLCALVILGQQALRAQANPFSEGTNDMVRAGHTMVFLAFFIAAVGIAFRIYFANKRRSNRAQGQMQMPWTPPPPTYPPAQPAMNYGPAESGVFCPRCGIRSGANYCIGCGYDLQNVIKQVHEQLTENR